MPGDPQTKQHADPGALAISGRNRRSTAARSPSSIGTCPPC